MGETEGNVEFASAIDQGIAPALPRCGEPGCERKENR